MVTNHRSEEHGGKLSNSRSAAASTGSPQHPLEPEGLIYTQVGNGLHLHVKSPMDDW